MKGSISRHYLAAGLAAWTLTGLGSGHPGSDGDLRGRIEHAIAQIRAGDLTKGPSLRHMGREAVPILIEYANDQSPDVRFFITFAVGQSSDERAIAVLVERLLFDVDSNVWETAVRGLRKYPIEVLNKDSSKRMVEALLTHARRWRGGSCDAVLLIGDVGAKTAAEDLHMILEEAKAIQGDVNDKDIADPEKFWEDERMTLVPRMKQACIKALFKLGDHKATDEVRASLKSHDLSAKAFGIEAVAYANKKEYINEVFAFLDDEREAVMPPGWPVRLRIKDLAVNAIVPLSGIQPSFRLGRLGRYTDDQVAEVKRLIREAGTE
jgi:hypothetical protein